MIMMVSLTGICGYRACVTGEFVCSWQSFPDISHTMGHAPLNKLYAIMLTIYSCTKQAEARAYHDKLSTMVSPLYNTVLLLAALTSFIFGPCIGYFDCYFDMPHHMLSAQLFTIGEIIYVVGVVYALCHNRSQFSPEANSTIDVCVKALGLMAIVAVLMQIGSGTLGFAVGQIGEWIAFYCDFFVRFNLAKVMKYKCIVV